MITVGLYSEVLSWLDLSAYHSEVDIIQSVGYYRADSLYTSSEWQFIDVCLQWRALQYLVDCSASVSSVASVRQPSPTDDHDRFTSSSQVLIACFLFDDLELAELLICEIWRSPVSDAFEDAAVYVVPRGVCLLHYSLLDCQYCCQELLKISVSNVGRQVQRPRLLAPVTVLFCIKQSKNANYR